MPFFNNVYFKLDLEGHGVGYYAKKLEKYGGKVTMNTVNDTKVTTDGAYCFIAPSGDIRITDDEMVKSLLNNYYNLLTD